MRTTCALLALVLTVFVGATISVAQVTTERPGNVRERLQNALGRVVVWVQDLDLSDDQEARIAAIRKEYQPKIEQDAKELKTLATQEVDQIKNILTPEQSAKVKGMLEERKEFKEESLPQRIAHLKELDLTEDELAKIAAIRNEFHPRMEETVKQLDGLLTDAQKNAREEAIKEGKTRREVIQALNLTSAQKSEVESTAKQLKELVGNELEKIQGVLTAEQRETLQDLRSERKELVRDQLAHQIANLRDLN